MSAYLDGELTAPDRSAFEVELAASEAAREQLDDIRQVRTALAGIGTVRAPRSFALLAPPAPVRVGPHRLEWVTRAGTGVAALLFVVALNNAGHAGDTPVTFTTTAAREAAAPAQAAPASKGASLATRSISGPTTDFATPTPTTAAAPTSAGPAPITAAVATPPRGAIPAPSGAPGGPLGPLAAPTALPPDGPTNTHSPTEPRALTVPTATGPTVIPAPAAAPPPASAPLAPSIAGATPTVVATFAAPGERGSEAFRPEPTAAAAAFATRTPDPVAPPAIVTSTPTPPPPTPVAQAPTAAPVVDTGTAATVRTSEGMSSIAVGLGALTLLLASASVVQLVRRRANPSK